jgi:hypothetical protein
VLLHIVALTLELYFAVGIHRMQIMLVFAHCQQFIQWQAQMFIDQDDDHCQYPSIFITMQEHLGTSFQQDVLII